MFKVSYISRNKIPSSLVASDSSLSSSVYHSVHAHSSQQISLSALMAPLCSVNVALFLRENNRLYFASQMSGSALVKREIFSSEKKGLPYSQIPIFV